MDLHQLWNEALDIHSDIIAKQFLERRDIELGRSEADEANVLALSLQMVASLDALSRVSPTQVITTESDPLQLILEFHCNCLQIVKQVKQVLRENEWKTDGLS